MRMIDERLGIKIRWINRGKKDISLKLIGTNYTNVRNYFTFISSEIIKRVLSRGGQN